MRCMTVLALFTLLSACASKPKAPAPPKKTPLEIRQERVLECVKELKVNHDFDSEEAFEVCRQIYRLRKLKD